MVARERPPKMPYEALAGLDARHRQADKLAAQL